MKNKTFCVTAVIVISVLGVAGAALADPVVYSDDNYPAVLPYTGTYPMVMFGNQTSNREILEAISGLCSELAGCYSLYKNEVGTGESGSFAASYETTFNFPNDPKEFVVSYVLSAPYITDPMYLLVKDGKHQPAWYLFDIGGWNGTDYLYGQGFWSDGGAISHIEIFGGGETYVPEPGSLLLLGAGLLGLAFFGRKFKK